MLTDDVISGMILTTEFCSNLAVGLVRVPVCLSECWTDEADPSAVMITPSMLDEKFCSIDTTC